MHLKLVAFEGPVVPHVHDEEERGSDDERDPTALIDLEKDSREISAFDHEG